MKQIFLISTSSMRSTLSCDDTSPRKGTALRRSCAFPRSARYLSRADVRVEAGREALNGTIRTVDFADHATRRRPPVCPSGPESCISERAAGRRVSDTSPSSLTTAAPASFDDPPPGPVPLTLICTTPRSQQWSTSGGRGTSGVTWPPIRPRCAGGGFEPDPRDRGSIRFW